jgi:hypothetical protein
MWCAGAGIAETNASWNSKGGQRRRKFKKIVDDKFKRSVFRTSTAAIQWEANYQLGGILTTVTGQWTQNITQHGSNPKLGQWYWVTIKGKGTNQTTLIMAYRVCDQTPITQDYVNSPCQETDSSTKLRTAHTQQFSLLLEDNAECCDPRQAFITDLEKNITSLTVDKNHYVILGIDANETFYEEIGESAILELI